MAWKKKPFGGSVLPPNTIMILRVVCYWVFHIAGKSQWYVRMNIWTLNYFFCGFAEDLPKMVLLSSKPSNWRIPLKACFFFWGGVPSRKAKKPRDTMEHFSWALQRWIFDDQAQDLPWNLHPFRDAKMSENHVKPYILSWYSIYQLVFNVGLYIPDLG